MNYKLSVSVVRPKRKYCFVIEAKGDELESRIGSIDSLVLKSEELKALTLGLRACRAYVKHDDLLIVELHNQHLCGWLNGSVEQKGYEKEMDEALDVLESLDCRVKFITKDKPYARVYLDKHERTSITGSSIKDMF